MAQGKGGFRRVLITGAVVLGALLVSAAIYWRADILQAALDPKQPFQTYSPPPAPDYAKASSWALIPDQPGRWTDKDLPADVFFIHPTTYDGGAHWNGPIGEAKADRLLTRVMLPNYAGPFYRVGRLFAPRYRQASLYSQLTNRDDAREARRFAYGDVRDAFRHYLNHYNFGRPFLIVGVEQGGILAARLVREEVGSSRLRVRQAAGVYLIDTVVPAADYGPGAALPACTSRPQTRCVMAWLTVPEANPASGQNRLARAQVWRGDELEDLGARPALCVNPLLGARTEVKAFTRANIGAANVTGLEWGARPAFLARQVEAQCKGGVLMVSKPRSPSLTPSGGWADRLKQPAYNLFYADLETDAQARVASLLNLADFPKPAPPIERSTDQGRTPAHRVGG
jgi:hypothetical protein